MVFCWEKKEVKSSTHWTRSTWLVTCLKWLDMTIIILSEGSSANLDSSIWQAEHQAHHLPGQRVLLCYQNAARKLVSLDVSDLWQRTFTIPLVPTIPSCVRICTELYQVHLYLKHRTERADITVSSAKICFFRELDGSHLANSQIQ